MKKIKINEQTLTKIIAESVKKILKEQSLPGLTPAPLDEKNVSIDSIAELLEEWDMVNGVKATRYGYFIWLVDGHNMQVSYRPTDNNLVFEIMFPNEAKGNEQAQYTKALEKSFIDHLLSFSDAQWGKYGIEFIEDNHKEHGVSFLVMKPEILNETEFQLSFWWAEE